MTDDSQDGGWEACAPPDGADSLRVQWNRDDAGRWVPTGMYLHAPVLTSDMLRAISLPRLEARRNAAGASLVASAFEILASDAPADWVIPGSAPRHRITRPDGSDPESFYRRVAMAYRQYAGQTKSPARAIAEEAAVPVTTVHRWVREARQRGFLPQGRRGKVG